MQLSLFNTFPASAMAAAALLACASIANAAEAPASISSALFETKHIDGLKAGTTLTYDFERVSSEPRMLGPNFTDDIDLTIKKVAENNTRTVGIRVFTGDRGRAVRTIDGMTGNPVLVFFLDRAVAGFSLLAGGNRAYHKNRFRVAMRTKGGLIPEKFEYNGKPVDGFRFAVRPFTGDRKNIDKMKGYQNAHFEFLMSDDLPGYFAEFTSNYSSNKPGSPSLRERIVLKGVKVSQKAAEPANPSEAKKEAEAAK
ncbi:MAG: hypothetical protein K0U74_06040 [Alphaproteobacteria bacterium]|nr:hypothetical protein [Alphaproteobacteria bacterium]